MFTSSLKREIRHFHVEVEQKQERNVQKSVMHVQSCCFAYLTFCFFDVLVAVRVVGSQSPLYVRHASSHKYFCYRHECDS